MVALAVSFALAGCSSVPFDYPKTTSRYQQALPESDLGRLHRDWRKRQGENSGFVGLPNGIEALGARLRLMEAAEHTIDAIRRELLDHTLFWSATDLENKLREYQCYYNESRTHSGRDGSTPTEATGSKVVDINKYRWKKFCRGLFVLPMVA